MFYGLPVIPDDGLIGHMDLLVWGLANGNNNCRIHLFANDYRPAPNTVLGSFTELIGAGYAPLPTGNPVNLGVDVARRDVWQFPETIWTALGIGLPVVAYGYWVDFTDPLTGGTRVLWAQRFQSPQVMLHAGDVIKFALSWGGKQC
jgi:hypothetical protein